MNALKGWNILGLDWYSRGRHIYYDPELVTDTGICFSAAEDWLHWSHTENTKNTVNMSCLLFSENKSWIINLVSASTQKLVCRPTLHPSRGAKWYAVLGKHWSHFTPHVPIHRNMHPLWIEALCSDKHKIVLVAKPNLSQVCVWYLFILYMGAFYRAK